MGRVCTLCGHPMLPEYEEMKKNGKTVKQIWEYAKSKHGSAIGYHSFQRHFQRCYQGSIDSQIRLNKMRDDVVRESIKKDMAVAKRLQRNLEICADEIEKIVPVEGSVITPDDASMLLKFMMEARLTIEQLLRWGEKLNIQDTSDDLTKKILFCLRDFPLDLIETFRERWKEVNEQ